MHRDPLQSSRGHLVTRRGQCRVVLCVVIESRHVPGHHLALPVLSRLYLNKAAAQKWNQAYRKKSELTLELLQILERHTSGSGKRRHLPGDSAFTAPDLLSQMPAGIDVTGRVPVNVRLQAPPAERQPGQNGRPRIRGLRLPTPAQMLQRKPLSRLTLKLFAGRAYRLRVATEAGRFYKAPRRDLRVIAVEHLIGGRGKEVFYTTDLSADFETIQRRYSWRWSIEVTFHDTKQHLRIEEPQNRTRPAVLRTAPTALLLYSLVLWWHETTRHPPVPSLRPWRGKTHPSFAEILSTLRLETLQNTVKTSFSTPSLPPPVKQLLEHLTRLFLLAT